MCQVELVETSFLTRYSLRLAQAESSIILGDGF